MYINYLKTAKYVALLFLFLYTYHSYCQQPCKGTPFVKDIRGNYYNTVQIGNQCWMKENLKTVYPVDDYWLRYKMENGVKYNCPSLVYNGSRRDICPQGWHVSSLADWMQLTDYVSSHEKYQCENRIKIADALKSQPDGNNLTGFSALPKQSEWMVKDGKDVDYFHLHERYGLFSQGGRYSDGRRWDDEYYYVRCVRDVSVSNWKSTPEEEAREAVFHEDESVVVNDLQGNWQTNAKKADRYYLIINDKWVKIKRGSRTMYDGRFSIDKGNLSAGGYAFQIIKNSNGKFQPVGFEMFQE